MHLDDQNVIFTWINSIIPGDQFPKPEFISHRIDIVRLIVHGSMPIIGRATSGKECRLLIESSSDTWIIIRPLIYRLLLKVVHLINARSVKTLSI
jgi:hypothetical protein